MKKLTVNKQIQCAACRACEVACSTAFYKTFDPDLSCIQITDKGDGTPKINYCIQCGKCAKVCEAGAIAENDKGFFAIDKKLCVGCLKCVEACPMRVMVHKEGNPAPSKCISCGICAKACPMGILEVKA